MGHNIAGLQKDLEILEREHHLVATVLVDDGSAYFQPNMNSQQAMPYHWRTVQQMVEWLYDCGLVDHQEDGQ